jgi:hypothetical protein
MEKAVMKNKDNVAIGFVKLNRTKDVLELIKRRPTAFILLTIIAFRARRTNEEYFDNLKIGEAEIGDYKSYKATEQVYKTDKKFLEKYGLATFKPTTKGTIARIISTSIFDINEEKLTNIPKDEKRTINEQPTINNNDNNENNENLIENIINNFNSYYETTIRTDDLKQVNAIKIILSTNYTAEDIINCAEWLLENEFWLERGVDFITIKDQIAKFTQVKKIEEADDKLMEELMNKHE